MSRSALSSNLSPCIGRLGKDLSQGVAEPRLTGERKSVAVPHVIDVPRHLRKEFGHQTTDQLLVTSAKRGNHRAFELLVMKYQSHVTRIVSTYIGDKSAVLDVTQETFIKAYKGLAGFRSESAFYTWVYRIATNTAINHINRSKNKSNPILVEDIEQVETYSQTPMNCHDPVSQLHSIKLYEHLNRILDDIPVKLKTALLLREREGLKYEDIAEIVGCPAGTVKSRVFRGRELVVSRMADMI